MLWVQRCSPTEAARTLFSLYNQSSIAKGKFEKGAGDVRGDEVVGCTGVAVNPPGHTVAKNQAGFKKEIDVGKEWGYGDQ
jgi:hypothetical protein